jgi:succinate-semialdehyde dehydrogenase/glutarate-semialdehyde dehydrogenase
MALKIQSNLLYSTDPRTDEIIGEFTATNPDDMPLIIQKVKGAFEHWSGLSLRTRLEIFKKAYRQFYRHQDEVARLISEETGKPLVEAFSTEILPVLDCFKYYIENVRKILKDQKISAMNPLFKLRRGFVRYEPLGVVAVISPWNYPFLLSMQHIVPAILAGNAVIFKPSEYTTLTGLKIRDIFDQAYLPKSVLEVVTGLADVGAALVNGAVDKIIFIGSTEVGKKIYQAAAKNLVPVSLELGGSDPMIVLQDANLERATNAAVWGAYSNAGQACLSVERLYVHESIETKFVEMLVQKVKALRLSANKVVAGDVACLANEGQFNKVRLLVEDALDKGAVVELGGKARKDLGEWYFEPTILTKVNSSMEIMKKECFGPLISVIPFSTDDQVVSLANDSEFGLSASIWTQNRKRGLELAKKVQAGSVLINDVQINIAQMEAPYTGQKNSGLGVSHGAWGVLEVMRPKYISADRPVVTALLKMISKRLANNDIWWFRYGDKVAENFKVFTAFLHGDSLWKKIKSTPAAIRALFRKDYL